MSVEAGLTEHYTHGGLEAALLAALAAMGKDVEHLSPADLMGADEFHVGGAAATKELAAQLGLRPGMAVLDIGSGLGGPARQMAGFGCHVTGIDLTPEYVEVAESLTRRMGMSGQVAFRQANADRLAFPDGSFDGVTLLHVGMNVPDKAGMFAAIHQVLKPGGFFAIYDVMRVGAGEIAFPMPWSAGPATSFVETPEAYRAGLVAAGFEIGSQRDRGDFARAFFAAQRARQAEAGPPPISLGLVLGMTGPKKIANLAGMIAGGVLAPYEIIARRG
jgi:SAM-dependent methyltransferase